MKKFISLLLVLMFSFGMFTTVRQEKAEAASVAIGYAVFKAGIAFTGFATYAMWFYANGYDMPAQELITAFANKYYDYANGVYTAKGDKINILDKFNLATSAFLTGNTDNVISFDLMREIQDAIVKDFPGKVSINDLSVTQNFTASSYQDIKKYYTFNNGYAQINDIHKDTVFSYSIGTATNTLKVYLINKIIGYTQFNSMFYPVQPLIMPDGTTLPFTNYGYLKLVPYSWPDLTFQVYGNNSTSGSRFVSDLIYGVDSPVKPDNDVDYNVKPGSYATGDNLFVHASPNYYNLLNGLAINHDDLVGLMNNDEYLQREVAQALENSTVNEENLTIAPEIGADGKLYYPGTVATPDIPYNPGQPWYDNLFKKVADIPDLLLGLPDLIGEKIAGIPILGDIVTTGQTVIEKLRDIGDSITGFIWGILQQILDAILGLPAKLIELLKDALIWLFVPDAEFLKDKVDIFKENFTFIDSFKQFVMLFDDMTSQNRVPTITLDFSKFKGSLGGKPISMGGQAFVLDMRFYDAYRVIGDIMITAFVYLMFAWRFFGRLPEIISGGGLLYAADNKTNDIINKLEGKKK